MSNRFLFFFVILLSIVACVENRNERALEIDEASLSSNTGKNAYFGHNRLSQYWYDGVAEISRYDLSQHRYGENHPGHTILIFVTEDFLTDKQVKNERYKNKNSVSVLKNHQMIEFPTGIYNYSIMNSIFTPVNNPSFNHTLKISSSSHDWCGLSYTQLNFKNNGYVIQQNSYLEETGDRETKTEIVILEDEIFNRIRMNPEELPVGQHMVIPSFIVSNFLQLEITPLIAILSNEPYEEDEFYGDSLKKYTINYPDLDRKLEIVYETKTPHKIIGWKDRYPSIFNEEPNTTIARKTHEKRSAYWQENKLEDMKMRAELGLK